MSGITAILNLQGRARRNALTASRVLQLRRAQQQEVQRVLGASAAAVLERAAQARQQQA